ncbi:MAG TPA: hypothetical protein VLX31_10030 [Streptosporangiaceae bacterium]|nr:hypothetical protein [Streptosporangiaceae bacterium]
MTILGIVFVGIAALACAAALLAILGIGQLALSGSGAIARDGLARGQVAPAWSLPDADGTLRSSPPGRPFQLIVFGDHSLRSFPSVVAGLRSLRDDPANADLEIVIVTAGDARLSQPALTTLGLDRIPVLTGSRALYARYNVRVMPFVIVVDAAGRVRASSLVNHDWQLAKLRRIAGLPLDSGDAAGVAGRAARQSQAAAV